MKLTLDMIAKDVAEKALDEFIYEGKTIREWVEILAKQQPCEDCVSRTEVDRLLMDLGIENAYDMPSFWANKGKDFKVIPTKWHQGYQQAIEDFGNRLKELSSVKSQRPKGKWLDKKMTIKGAHGMAYGRYACSVCKKKFPNKSNYCPNCGAEMEGDNE